MRCWCCVAALFALCGATTHAGIGCGASAAHWERCYDNEQSTTGVVVTAGLINVSFCNKTAWTFRDLIYEGVQVLSPTGFTQTVSNVNIQPNTGA